MKHHVFVLVIGLCLLAATASAAGPDGLRVAGIGSGTTAAPGSGPGVPQIFVWVPQQPLPELGTALLEVEILKNGQVASRETALVSLAPAEGRRGIEIFAFRPAVRDLYAKLVQRDNVRLEARLRLAGGPWEEVLLRDLTRSAEAGGKLQLLPLRAAESPQGPDHVVALSCSSERTACLQQCEDDMFACSEALSCDWCEECEPAYYECRDNCPVCCTEPKSVSYTTSVEVVSATWSGSNCYSPYPSSYGTIWDQYYLQLKYTRYKHTTHCDNSVTTTVDSVWYGSGSCWQEQYFFTCPYPLIYTPVPSC